MFMKGDFFLNHNEIEEFNREVIAGLKPASLSKSL